MSQRATIFVMAGLVPAIHVFLLQSQIVDARVKSGHDELKFNVDANNKVVVV